MSINNIAKELKVNWRTVKKYAEREDWNVEVKEKEKTYPVLGNYLDVIDMWLIEDSRSRNRKQHHTNRRIFHRLRDECGYTGGERTVTTYVAKRKRQMATAGDSYTKLLHPGGEAQVDYGTTDVYHNQKIIQVKYLSMSFPFSNASYTWVLPSENIQCFLTGLQELFTLTGGIPKKIWFDNLSAAVAKIERGQDRITTEAFKLFSLHYGFHAEFCNVGKGSDKGNVENKIGTTRRNCFVPMLEMTNWQDINQILLEKAVTFLKETHYEKKRSIGDLFTEEKELFMPLPLEPYDIFDLKTAKLDKYSRVRFEKEFHAIPKGNALTPVVLKVYWDEVQVLNEAYKQIGVFSRSYSLKEQSIEWEAELQLIQHKPRAIPYSSVYSILPIDIKSYVGIKDLNKRRSRVGQLIQWLQGGYTINSINVAIGEISPELLDQEGVIYQRLYQGVHPVRTFEILAETYTPGVCREYDPDLTVYDVLSVRKALN